MSVSINDSCINCGPCRDVCPNRAIAEFKPGHASLPDPSVFFVVDSNLCTECVGHYGEPQCMTVCPVEAIEILPEHVESPEILEARVSALKVHREALGLPGNIAFAEPGGSDLKIPKGFGPHPTKDINQEWGL